MLRQFLNRCASVSQWLWYPVQIFVEPTIFSRVDTGKDWSDGRVVKKKTVDEAIATLSLLPIFSGIDPAKNLSRSKSVNPVQIAAPSKPVITEPVIQNHVKQKVTGRNAYSTPSILDALRDDVKTDDTDNPSEIDADQYSRNETYNPFSYAELLDSWKSFVSTIDAAQLKSALGTREPILTEGWQVEYELDTELQLNRLTLDLKPKLLGYLRNRLRNDAIEIQFKISAGTDDKSNIPYTEAERWASLVEKYPALAMLKSKFGLDFEHF